MSKTELFIKEIIEHLEKSNVTNVNEVKILSDLEKIGSKISFDPKYGSYLSSAEILRRYGNQIIPEDVLAILKIADIWSLENAKTKNFRYLRLVAQGWELFEDTPYLPLIHALFSKFRGVSAFGNLQIWEHFGGLMTIGTDKEDNRYFVSSIDEQSSVFWMNHESESPGLNRWVCQNFSSFIKFQLGCNLPEIDRLWMGKQGLGKVISKKNPIEPRLNWSPFLIDRSEWIIQSIYLGNINEISESAFYFDWELEKEMLEKSEPLALYWLFRSFLLNEEQKFQDTYKVVNQLSPLITSACKILLTEWTLDDSESRFCIARAKIREIADKLKVAKQSPQIRY